MTHSHMWNDVISDVKVVIETLGDFGIETLRHWPPSQNTQKRTFRSHVGDIGDFSHHTWWVMTIIRHHVWMCFECWNMLKHDLRYVGTWYVEGSRWWKKFFLTTMTTKEEDLGSRSLIERCVLEAIEHADGLRFWLSMFLLVLDILGGIIVLRQAYTWLDFLPVLLRRVEVVKSSSDDAHFEWPRLRVLHDAHYMMTIVKFAWCSFPCWRFRWSQPTCCTLPIWDIMK